jgi:peptidoglycan/xylan/chitin deacetylase (PgdA/CDA1 family)
MTIRSMRPPRIRTALRSVAAGLYSASPHFLAYTMGKVVILMYHRVLPCDDVAATVVQPAMYVTADTFERHLQFLSSRFRILSFQELLARCEAQEWDHRTRYCAITFDDGWVDNYRHAFPLLRAFGAPATIFLPTSLIGTERWLWSDQLGYFLGRGRASQDHDAIDSLIERAKRIPVPQRDQLIELLTRAANEPLPRMRQFMNWDEVREMSAQGISFGSHTCSHAMLTGLDGSALERELRGSLDVLRAQNINDIPVLSYPNGDHDDLVVAAARAAGYRAAVTTLPGCEQRRPGDLFRLRRIGVHEDVSRLISLLTFHVARQSASVRHIA